MSDTLDTATRWELVDAITEETVEYGDTEPSLSEHIGELTVSPWVGLPFAVAVLYGVWRVFGAVAGFFSFQLSTLSFEPYPPPLKTNG